MGNVRKWGRGFQLRYQVGGQRVEETVRVNTKTEAVNLLKVREGQATEGRTPTFSARRLRFEDLASDLKCDYELNGRHSLKNLQSYLAHLGGFFAGRRAVTLTTSDALAYAARRKQAGAASATINRELATLRRMFSLAVRAAKLDRRPQIPMLREENVRRGFLTPDQFARVLASLPAYLQPVAEFAYRSGWRRSEITSLGWEQVDLGSATIRLWPGTTKNREGRVLPLEGELRRVIEQQYQTRPNGCSWVFHCHGRRIVTVNRAWTRACARVWWTEQKGDDKAPLPEILEEYLARGPRLLFHDLRRTAARNFRRAGLSENEAMALTGHKTPAIFRRYSIIAEEDLRDAVRASEAYLAIGGSKVGQESEHPESLILEVHANLRG